MTEDDPRTDEHEPVTTEALAHAMDEVGERARVRTEERWVLTRRQLSRLAIVSGVATIAALVATVGVVYFGSRVRENARNNRVAICLIVVALENSAADQEGVLSNPKANLTPERRSQIEGSVRFITGLTGGIRQRVVCPMAQRTVTQVP